MRATKFLGTGAVAEMREEGSMSDWIVGGLFGVVLFALFVVWALAGGAAAAVVTVIGLLVVIAVLLARIARHTYD